MFGQGGATSDPSSPDPSSPLLGIAMEVPIEIQFHDFAANLDATPLNAGMVRVTQVPEPSSLVLLAMGWFACGDAASDTKVSRKVPTEAMIRTDGRRELV